jgi:hypothetical protein
VVGEGAHIKEALYALEYYEPSVSYSYQDKFSIDELRVATGLGPTIISIQTPIIGHGFHPVIVDGFKDNYVLIGSHYHKEKVQHTKFIRRLSQKRGLVKL